MQENTVTYRSKLKSTVLNYSMRSIISPLINYITTAVLTKLIRIEYPPI